MNLVPSVKSIASAVVLVLIGAGVGWGLNPGGMIFGGDTVIKTEVPEDFVDEFQRLSIEATQARAESESLRGRLKQMATGVETRVPDVIVRTDTVLLTPDTVATAVNVEADGNLRIPTLRRDSLHADSLRVPEIIEYRDVWDCEDGFSVSVTGAILKCNEARFGHLSVLTGVGGSVDGADVSGVVNVGAQWTPSYRSPWRVEVGHNLMAGAWEVRFVRLFEIPLP